MFVVYRTSIPLTQFPPLLPAYAFEIVADGVGIESAAGRTKKFGSILGLEEETETDSLRHSGI
jgi:hypothetical protein